MRPVDAEDRLEAPGFAISSDPGQSPTASDRTRARAGHRSAIEEACVSNHGLTRLRPVKGRFRRRRRARQHRPGEAQHLGRDLRPHFLLSTPHAASLPASTGKLTRFKSASRAFVCHPQTPPIRVDSHRDTLTPSPARCPLWIPEALPGLLLAEQKASQSLPALQAPVFEPAQPPSSEAMAPRSSS